MTPAGVNEFRFFSPRIVRSTSWRLPCAQQEQWASVSTSLFTSRKVMDFISLVQTYNKMPNSVRSYLDKSPFVLASLNLKISPSLETPIASCFYQLSSARLSPPHFSAQHGRIPLSKSAAHLRDSQQRPGPQRARQWVVPPLGLGSLVQPTRSSGHSPPARLCTHRRAALAVHNQTAGSS